MRILIGLIAAVLVLWLCVAIVRPQAAVLIRWSPAGLRCRGAYPRGKRTDLEAFLKREFPGARLTIRGIRSARGMLWVIRGQVTAGQQQQIRNYLNDAL